MRSRWRWKGALPPLLLLVCSAAVGAEPWRVSQKPVGRRYLCPRAAKPPVIDGKLDEWTFKDAPIQVNRRLAPKIGIISNFVRDDADLKAEGCFSWDDANLYFAFSVDDDVVIEVAKDPPASLKPWQTDSIMICFHTGEGLDGEADTFVGVAPVKPGVGQPFLLPSMGVRSAVVRRDRGYNVEIAVPFKGWKTRSRPGQVIRIALLIPDCDDDKGTSSPTWKQVSWHYPKGVWTTAEFGEVYLLGGDPFFVTCQVGRPLSAVGAPLEALVSVDAFADGVKLTAVELADAHGKPVVTKALAQACPRGNATTVTGRLPGDKLKPGRYHLTAIVMSGSGQRTVVGPAVTIIDGPAAPSGPDVTLVTDAARIARPNLYPGRRELRFKKADYLEALEHIVARSSGFKPGSWDYPVVPAVRYLATGKDSDAREAMDAIKKLVPKDPAKFRPGWPWTPPLTAAWILRDWPSKTDADQAALKKLFTAWTPYEIKHLERGAMNRSFSRGHHLKGFARLVPDLDKAKLLNAVADGIWWDMAAAGDTDESSENYNGHFFLFLLKFADYRGEKPDGPFWSNPAVKRMVYRYRDYLTPLGAPPHYGDGGAWCVEPWIWCPLFERAATVYRDGTLKWAAHRAWQYGMEHYERFLAWHWLGGGYAESFAMAYMYADDSIEPVAPPAASKVLHRRAIQQVFGFERQMGHYFQLKPEDVPDKLVLRSGWDPADLYALVGLFPNSGHGDFESPAIQTMTGGGAVLLRSADYSERKAETLNSLAIEDLQGVSGQLLRTTVTVPAFQEGHRATYARALVQNYEGLPAAVEREFIFLKNAFLVVRDRVRFAEAFRCRVGQWWHATAAGPKAGPNWVNLYQKPLAEQYGGTWTHYDRDVLVYALPRPDTGMVGRHDSRYRFCYRWEGIPEPGRDLYFTAVLLPHRPTADLAKQIGRITTRLDDGTAAVVSVAGEAGKVWWIASNPEAKTLTAGPLKTDARVAAVLVRDGRAVHAFVHEARVLTFAGQAIVNSAQKTSLDKEVTAR